MIHKKRSGLGARYSRRFQKCSRNFAGLHRRRRLTSSRVHETGNAVRSERKSDDRGVVLLCGVLARITSGKNSNEDSGREDKTIVNCRDDDVKFFAPICDCPEVLSSRQGSRKCFTARAKSIGGRTCGRRVAPSISAASDNKTQRPVRTCESKALLDFLRAKQKFHRREFVNRRNVQKFATDLLTRHRA